MRSSDEIRKTERNYTNKSQQKAYMQNMLIFANKKKILENYFGYPV